MPTTRNFSSTDPQRRYRISCSHCGTECLTDSPWSRDAMTPNGDLVRETFTFIRSRDRFYSRCRECDRALAPRFQNRGQRRAPRVPSMTRREALGAARKFGVEFECAFPNVSGETIAEALRAAGIRAVSSYTQRGANDWLVKGDPSISIPGHNGREIVSPPLSGDDGEQQVRTVARVLRSLGGVVNRTCGTHVHHDVNDLTVDDIKRTTRSWFENQGIVSGLVAPSRRAGGTFYCQPLNENDMARVERITTLGQMRSVSVDRYRSLNLQAYGKHGTVEIRQHQGTLDAEKVISWIRLGQAIIDTSKVEGRSLTRAASVRDLFGQLGARMDETARTFLLGRAVEFDAVAV